MKDMSPSIVLCSARVLSYAIVDETVNYNELGLHFVDGKLLGVVPRIAICQNIGEDDYLILYCDNEWNSLGAGGDKTIDSAKKYIEKSYSGLINKWIDTDTTKEQAIEYLDEYYSDEKCSFCGKWPLDTELMIGDDVRICNHCVDEFHGIIHSDENPFNNEE